MTLANRDHCSRDGGKRERLGCEGVCIKTKKRDQTSGIEWRESERRNVRIIELPPSVAAVTKSLLFNLPTRMKITIWNVLETSLKNVLSRSLLLNSQLQLIKFSVQFPIYGNENIGFIALVFVNLISFSG